MYIELKNVSKSIKGVPILTDISLKMTGGKIYGFQGKNGCGKTMLTLFGRLSQDIRLYSDSNIAVRNPVHISTNL